MVKIPGNPSDPEHGSHIALPSQGVVTCYDSEVKLHEILPAHFAFMLVSPDAVSSDCMLGTGCVFQAILQEQSAQNKT